VTPIKARLCASYPFFSFQTPSRLHSDGKLSYQSGLRAAIAIAFSHPKREKVSFSFLYPSGQHSHLKENVCAAALTWERRRDLCAAHNQVSGLMSGENGHYAATDRRGGFRRTRGLLRYCVYMCIASPLTRRLIKWPNVYKSEMNGLMHLARYPPPGRRQLTVAMPIPCRPRRLATGIFNFKATVRRENFPRRQRENLCKNASV
jgi:hypothetical protein